jgi:hypothetical protein
MATKMSWADIADEEDAKPPEPVALSRHGIKIKKPVVSKPSYVPPHLRDKSKSVTNNKDND